MANIKLSPNNAPEKILVCSAERVGDTLFCTPGIKLLKQSLPHTKIDVLAFSKLAENILSGNPSINKIHLATSSAVIQRIMGEYPLSINLFFEMIKPIGKLQQADKFISIHFPDQRIHRSQQIFNFVNTLIDKPIQDFEIDYDIYPQQKDHQQVIHQLKEQGIDVNTDILIGCQLGCHRVARRGWKIWNRKRHQHKKVWPLESYTNLAKRLTEYDQNIRFILTGAPSERYLAKMFLAQFPQAIDLIGKTNIHEVTALMDVIKVLITHDTGTMHLACARKTPMVALFGATPVEFTGPFPTRPQYTIIQKNNMASIQVNEVYKTIIDKLNVIR